MKKAIAVAIIFVSCCSCSNYYKVITVPEPIITSNIEALKNQNKYFILRNGDQAFTMKNVSFTADQKSMECNLEYLPGEHTLYMAKAENSKMKYKKTKGTGDESMVLNEVHFYIERGGTIPAGPYNLALNRVQKMEVIEKDIQKTKKSQNIETVVFMLGLAIVLTGIAFIIAMNGL